MGPARLFGAVDQGLTVLKNGATYTSHAAPTTAQIKAADTAYLGGHEYEVDQDEKDAIEASGVGGTFVSV